MSDLETNKLFTDFLAYYNLSKYERKLQERDIISLEDLDGLDEEDIRTECEAIHMAKLHTKRFITACKDLNNGMWFIKTQQYSTNEVELKSNQNNSNNIIAGWIDLSINNTAFIQVYCVWKPNQNQIYVYDNDNINGEVLEIIWLSTCTKKEGKASKSNQVTFYDNATATNYTFKPYDDGFDALAWHQKLVRLIQAQWVDIIWGWDLTSQQSFNRFLKAMKKTAIQQSKKIPEFSAMVYKAVENDKALKKELNWLERFVMDKDSKKVLGQGFSIRNQFWNLISDTREAFNEDYCKSVEVCQSLLRWQQILNKKQGEITEKERKILLYGLQKLLEFQSEDKQKRMKLLHERWKRLRNEMCNIQTELIELSKKWGDKHNNAKQISAYADWTMVCSGIIGIVSCIAASVYSIPALAIFGGVMIGIEMIAFGTSVYFDAQASIAKGIQNKIDKTRKDVKKCEQHFLEWIEAINLMKVSITNINPDLLSDKMERDKNGLIELGEFQLDLLKGLSYAFKVFRDRCKKALEDIRKAQQQI